MQLCQIYSKSSFPNCQFLFWNDFIKANIRISHARPLIIKSCRPNLSRSVLLCSWEIWPACFLMKELSVRHLAGQICHGHFSHEKGQRPKSQDQLWYIGHIQRNCKMGYPHVTEILLWAPWHAPFTNLFHTWSWDIWSVISLMRDTWNIIHERNGLRKICITTDY